MHTTSVKQTATSTTKVQKPSKARFGTTKIQKNQRPSKIKKQTYNPLGRSFSGKIWCSGHNNLNQHIKAYVFNNCGQSQKNGSNRFTETCLGLGFLVFALEEEKEKWLTELLFSEILQMMTVGSSDGGGIPAVEQGVDHLLVTQEKKGGGCRWLRWGLHAMWRRRTAAAAGTDWRWLGQVAWGREEICGGWRRLSLSSSTIVQPFSMWGPSPFVSWY